MITRYHHWRNQFEKRGITSNAHPRTGMTYKTRRRIKAELWFEEFAESFANRMPDVKRRELPSCMTISQVYETYKEATQKRALSRTQFRRMWKEQFRDVIIPKVMKYFTHQLAVLSLKRKFFMLNNICIVHCYGHFPSIPMME